jgi:hypothetical protein
MVNALLAMLPGVAITSLLLLLLTMSSWVWATAGEPEWVSAMLEKEAEPKSARVD